jgi:uncharacterized protein with GYD domain
MQGHTLQRLDRQAHATSKRPGENPCFQCATGRYFKVSPQTAFRSHIELAHFLLKGHAMPQYLVQVSYTSEALAALVSSPENRIVAVSKAVKKLGGKVHDGWMTFGEFDTALIMTLPDNVAAAAFALAIGSGGACKDVRTTPLLSVKEGVEAMKAAGTLGYKPPAA